MAAPVSVRLSDEKWQLYSDLAQAQGIGLSTYLKRRLEQGDRVVEQIDSLRRVIEASLVSRAEETGIDQPEPTQISATVDLSIIVEILLLIRSVVGESKLHMIHSELRRRNVSIWTGEEGERK